MKLAHGFQFSGVHAGIKPNRKDLALVYSRTPCSAAACLTRNRAQAAPVLDCAGRFPASGLHAVVANSGNANALTGPAGAEDERAMAAAVAAALGISAVDVL